MSDISQATQGGTSRLHRLITDPVNIAMLLLLFVLSYLVIWPFVQLLIETLTWGQGDDGFRARQCLVSSPGFIGCRQPQARCQVRCFMGRWSTRSKLALQPR